MGGGSSTSNTSTTTTSTSDSNNTTTSLASDLSNVGNTAINIGADNLGADSLVKLLPFAIMGGILMIVALTVTFRR